MRLLFLTHRLPYAPNRGDRVRAFHLLRILRQRFEVDLLSLVHDDEEASHAGDVQSRVGVATIVRVPRIRNVVRTIASLPGSTPATHTMLDSPTLLPALRAHVARRRPDVLLAYCSGMARLAFDESVLDIPLILDMVDVDSLKWAALVDGTAPPRCWIYARESRLLARFETLAATRALSTLVVNQKERDALLKIAPDARVEVVANGVDIDALSPKQPPSEDPIVTFCGVMNYGPNEEGALWLAREVWPIVRSLRPDARLKLVGSTPTRSVTSLADTQLAIEVTGGVPDVRPYLWSSAVAVAPLLRARGIQNKVLEAVAAGLPTVVTPVVAEGLPMEVGAACVVAADAGAFARAVVSLLDLAPEERRQLAASANLKPLSWERTMSRLGDMVFAAAGR